MDHPQSWHAGVRPSTTTRSWRVADVGPASVTVDLQRGARVAALDIEGQNILVGLDGAPVSPFGDGLFAMAPYAGRVNQAQFRWKGTQYALPENVPPHSAHGVAADVEWKLVRPGVFRVDLDDRWPLGGFARQEIRTSVDGLEILLTVGNDIHAMPANPGLHPWFRRKIVGSSAILTWPAELVYADDQLITLRSLVVHDPASRTWTAPASKHGPMLTWPGRLEVALSSIEARCWVVHETETAICVEPQIAPGDALNAGDAMIVSPGDPCTIDLRMTMKRAPIATETEMDPVHASPGEGRTPHPPTPTPHPGRS